jgi:hypothetical protein
MSLHSPEHYIYARSSLHPTVILHVIKLKQGKRACSLVYELPAQLAKGRERYSDNDGIAGLDPAFNRDAAWPGKDRRQRRKSWHRRGEGVVRGQKNEGELKA